MSRWFHLGLVLLALGFGGYGISRLSYNVEVMDLLPQNLRGLEGTRLLRDTFQRANTLIITLEGDDPDLVDQAATSLDDTLAKREDLCRRVRSKSAWEENSTEFADMSAYAWLNAPTAEVQALAASLAPDKAPGKLQAAIEEVSTSSDGQGIALGSYDPLGFSAALRGGLDPVIMNGEGRATEFGSADGKFRLLFLEPDQGYPSYRQLADWIARLKGSGIEPWRQAHPEFASLKLGYTGEPSFRAEIATGMEGDMRQGIGLVTIIVGLLFWLLHRTLKPLFLLLLALLCANLLTLGVAGLFFGSLNVMSMGFAAILTGMIEDFGVVGLHESLNHPEDDFPAVIKRVFPGVAWSAFTAACVFGALAMSSLPGISHLGILTSLGILIGAAVMLYGFLPLAMKATVKRPRRSSHTPPGIGAQSPNPRDATPQGSSDDPSGVGARSHNPRNAIPQGSSDDPSGVERRSPNPRDAIPQGSSDDPPTLATPPHNPRDATPQGSARSKWLRVLPGWVTCGITGACLVVLLARGLPPIYEGQGVLRPVESPSFEAFERMQAALSPSDLKKEWLYLIAVGKSEAEVVGAMEKARGVLEAAKTRGEIDSFFLPTNLFPQGERQRANAALLAGLASQKERLAAATTAAGYTEEGFALAGRVLDLWAQWCAAPPQQTFWPTAELLEGTLGKVVQRNPERMIAAGFLLMPSSVRPFTSQVVHDLEAIPGMKPAGWRYLSDTSQPLYQQELRRICLPAALVLLLLLPFVFRGLREILFALGSLAFSGLMLLGGMSAFGQEWNFVSIGAIPLSLGLGLDFTIHMIYSLRDYDEDGGHHAAGLGRALAYCGLSTGLAFGSLALAGNKGLISLGVCAMIGVLSTLFTAAFVLPWAWGKLRFRTA